MAEPLSLLITCAASQFSVVNVLRIVAVSKGTKAAPVLNLKLPCADALRLKPLSVLKQAAALNRKLLAEYRQTHFLALCIRLSGCYNTSAAEVSDVFHSSSK
jgi:hypothetical protein